VHIFSRGSHFADEPPDLSAPGAIRVGGIHRVSETQHPPFEICPKPLLKSTRAVSRDVRLLFPFRMVQRRSLQTPDMLASSAAFRERAGCATGVLTWHHVAPVRKELRNASNRSERESTSGRSRNYGNAHLIPIVRGIARTPASGRSLCVQLRAALRPTNIGRLLWRGSFKLVERNMVSSKAKIVSIVFRASVGAQH
jgi:hypothetical protein